MNEMCQSFDYHKIESGKNLAWNLSIQFSRDLRQSFSQVFSMIKMHIVYNFTLVSNQLKRNFFPYCKHPDNKQTWLGLEAFLTACTHKKS